MKLQLVPPHDVRRLQCAIVTTHALYQQAVTRLPKPTRNGDRCLINGCLFYHPITFTKTHPVSLTDIPDHVEFVCLLGQWVPRFPVILIGEDHADKLLP